MNKRTYIAGPVTGVSGFEKHFRKAAELLRSKGFEPVDPTAPGLVPGAGYRYYIDRGLRLLEDCGFIAMLPGSEKSKGARLELHYAVLVGMPVLQISEYYTKILNGRMEANYDEQ